MKNELTCNQVSALLSFYLENKLNARLKECVDKHLEKCSACKKKVKELQKIFAQKTQNNKIQLPLESIHRLSAYIDNELNSDDNIKTKKMAISNPSARKELEIMTKNRELLHSAYEKTKTNIKFDYSKDIISQMQDSSEYDYTTTYFYKIATIFAMLLLAIIAGFIYLYF